MARYLSKQSNLKHTKDIVKEHHSKHLNQTLPLRGSLTTGGKSKFTEFIIRLTDYITGIKHLPCTTSLKEMRGKK